MWARGGKTVSNCWWKAANIAHRNSYTEKAAGDCWIISMACQDEESNWKIGEQKPWCFYRNIVITSHPYGPSDGRKHAASLNYSQTGRMVQLGLRSHRVMTTPWGLIQVSIFSLHSQEADTNAKLFFVRNLGKFAWSCWTNTSCYA